MTVQGWSIYFGVTSLKRCPGMQKEFRECDKPAKSFVCPATSGG